MLDGGLRLESQHDVLVWFLKVHIEAGGSIPGLVNDSHSSSSSLSVSNTV